MESTKMMQVGHDEHLCYLANLGFLEESPQNYVKLVRDANYMCKHCGRVADYPDNLCNPTRL